MAKSKPAAKSSKPAAKKPAPKPAPAAAKKAAAAKPAAKPAAKAKPAPSPTKPVKPSPKPSAAKPTSKPAPAAAKKAAPAPAPAPKKASPPAPAPAAAKKTPPPAPAAKASAPKPDTKKTGDAAPAPKPAGKKPVTPPNGKAGLTTKKGKHAPKVFVRPPAFTFDEAREVLKTNAAKAAAESPAATKAAAKGAAAKTVSEDSLRAAKPARIGAASLADILGFNPKARSSAAENEEAAIPEKFKRYYKLLVELRSHLTGQLDAHSEETLKRSAKDDAGDLSSYGTDGGTDTFDRDFALSMVANEQEALSEIEAAVQRIKAGTYGVCEITQKPISKERLIAVPFTRFTAEAAAEAEKTRYKSRGQAGIFGEGEEGGASGGGDDDGE